MDTYKKEWTDTIMNISPVISGQANADDDVEQSLSQGGITVEGDLEQLDGNSIRSNSLSVC